MSLRLTIYTDDGTTMTVVNSYTTGSAGDLTVVGTDDNGVRRTFDAEDDCAAPGNFRYVLWDDDQGEPLAKGALSVLRAQRLPEEP